MMEAILPRTRKEEFELAAAIQKELVLEKLKLARFEARMKREIEHEQIEQEKEDRETSMAIESAIAPPQAVIEYRNDVDHFGVVTVDALMDNEEASERLRKQTEKMLTEAHILPDGRRVFKTMDGKKVFDQQGQEIAADIIDPRNIDDKRTRWETFNGAMDERLRLREEREELLAYQQKLDDALERLDKGEITNGELDRFKDDLSQSMPDSVRQKIAMEKPETEAEQRLSATAPVPVLPNNMGMLVRQSGISPSGR